MTQPLDLFKVRQVRGPFIKLPPHPSSVDSEQDLRGLVARLRAASTGTMVGADLFSGAGGLSLGLEQAGITTVLAVDKDLESVATHRHHFPGLTVDWDLSDPDVVERVGRLLAGLDVDVLAGGPPCQPFSKAGRSRIRHEVRVGGREAQDHRRDLWRAFLEVVRLAAPRAVVMENVPDMALDREVFILRAMVLELERLGYAVEERVVDTWRYGVPQFRQRLVLVALRDGVRFRWPAEVASKTTVDNATSDLPPVQGGWRPAGGAQGWSEYGGPVTRFQRAMREGVPVADVGRVFDHVTRPVREDDLQAFELMDAATRYSDLPPQLRRYRDDIFDDKYKRLDGNDLSRTITAHIAKDGYSYIHPTQHRTLTVREAARLQTFPDWFRFSGPPSAAFRQIGNAVPPMLGRAVGNAIRSALNARVPGGPSSEEVSSVLAAWFRSCDNRAVAWLDATTRWQVISGDIVLDRVPAPQVRHVWPVLRRWREPQDTLGAREDLLEMCRWIDRGARGRRLLTAADALSGTGSLGDEALGEAVARKVLPPSTVDLTLLAVPMSDDDACEEPILTRQGVLRVAARFCGEPVDRRNRLTDGKLAVARMVGYGTGSRHAQLALFELAADVCRPVSPDCQRCPLSAWCVSSRSVEMESERLPFPPGTGPSGS